MADNNKMMKSFREMAGLQARVYEVEPAADCPHHWIGCDGELMSRTYFTCKRCGAVMHEPITIDYYAKPGPKKKGAQDG